MAFERCGTISRAIAGLLHDDRATRTLINQWSHLSASALMKTPGSLAEACPPKYQPAPTRLAEESPWPVAWEERGQKNAHPTAASSQSNVRRVHPNRGKSAGHYKGSPADAAETKFYAPA